MVQADHHSLNGPLDVHPFATLPAGEITVKPRNRLTARQCGQGALQISTDASSLSRVPARTHWKEPYRHGAAPGRHIETFRPRRDLKRVGTGIVLCIGAMSHAYRKI